MPTVFIVDDDKAFQKQLRTLFEHDTSFEACLEIRNGAEALRTMKRISPSLVIVNFSLPDMNGLELAQKLKAITPEMPVFMLATDYCVKVEKKALSYGITAVFSKLDDLAMLVVNARAVCGIE